MSVRREQSLFWIVRLAVIDLLVFWGCCIIAVALRNYTFAFVGFSLVDAASISAICVICLSIVGGYDARRDMSTLRYASEHFLAMGAALLLALIETYVFATFNNAVKPGRFVLIFGLILFTPVALSYRYLFSLRVRREARDRFIYVIGTADLAANLEAMCRLAHFRHPLRFVDLPTARDLPQSQETVIDWAKESRHLHEVLTSRMENCEGVVIDLSKGKLPEELAQCLLNLNLHNVPVYPVDAFVETYFNKIDLTHVNLSWALDGTFKADHHSAYGNIKTLFDTLSAGFIFILTLPLMLLIALVIRVFDGGPVLYTQMRVGRFERPFRLYKFRTMALQSDTGQDGLYTQKNDSRITCCGQLLRRTRLDELPQIWNVIRGDMSMIGPRAEWDRLVDRYKKEIPFYHLRYMVKPGITGWAQVNYGYGADIKDTFEKLQYDLYYIKHYSPQMDASIILKTLFTILSASGR